MVEVGIQRGHMKIQVRWVGLLIGLGGTVSSAWGGASFRGLGDLPGGRFESFPAGISADGKVVVGQGVSEAAGAYSEAFRWTLETGMVGLGDLPGDILN